LVFRAAIGGEKEDGSKKFVIRPYTPTSPKDAKGYFDLVVKVYEQGKMSKHFGELKVLIFSSTLYTAVGRRACKFHRRNSWKMLACHFTKDSKNAEGDVSA
jgi:hypothetical protein